MPASSGIIALALAALIAASQAAIADDLPAGFVRLTGVDPTIRQDIRYAGSANFLGRPVKGYLAAECLLTDKAASALAAVQASFKGLGLTLVVFDCYRPMQAVDDLVDWSRKGGPPEPQWFPKVSRGDLVAKGYVGARSNHNRGSTVDIALAHLDSETIQPVACGATAPGLLDFGSGFDCFDEVSKTDHPGVGAEPRANRDLLRKAMRAAGFRNYAGEWWHFTLDHEPFPKQSFDFPVTSTRS